MISMNHVLVCKKSDLLVILTFFSLLKMVKMKIALTVLNLDEIKSRPFLTLTIKQTSLIHSIVLVNQSSC